MHKAIVAKQEEAHYSKYVRLMMTLLLFLQKQNLASAIYLFGLGTRLF